jgi:hypothetical protein
MLMMLISCTSVKRFKAANYQSEDNSLVQVDLFNAQLTNEDEGQTGGTLWKLSAGAQTQFVQILDRRYPDNGPFIEALGRQYPEVWSRVPGDFTNKQLRMVFSIRKVRDYRHLNDPEYRFSPADRIEYISLKVSLPEAIPLQFSQWNRFSTEYGEIELADITFSRNLMLEAEGNAEGVDISSRGTFGKNEEQAVRARFLRLNGTLDNRWIQIEEEGTREIDLTGNVLADIALRFEGFPERITFPVFTSTVEENGSGSELKTLLFRDLLVPRMEEVPDSIFATMEVDYIYRHVQSGWKTFQEWDDRVEYYSGTIQKKVPLFTRQEYVPDFFSLGTEIPKKEAIRIRSRGGREYPLQFLSFQDASMVLDWILDQQTDGPVRVGNHILIYKGIPLSPNMLNEQSEIKVLPVY